MDEPSPKRGSMVGTDEIGMRSAATLSKPNRLGRGFRLGWATLLLAVKKFSRIDGAQRAGAFAFNVFFSLFPLMLLLITIASFFVDRERAEKVVMAHLGSYVPISGELQSQILGTVAGVIQARRQAGAVAFLVLLWPATQCFTTLIYATNRAWGTAVDNWWRQPLKSLNLLGITTVAVLLGMAAPVLLRMTQGSLFPVQGFHFWVYGPATFFIPLLLIFFSLSLFYRLAPRRPTRFAEVWAAALCATILLRAAQSLFLIYLEHFSKLNAVYGAFGGIMAVLLWIYFSGCIFIFGACLCAGQAEALGQPACARVFGDATAVSGSTQLIATRESE
jgi:YihY family inner membrane protein